ncbi:3-hydroxyisobutyrate dehydrogenase [Chitinophaga costaii]|uniref:3-hydroxyisobutyrate dehydrogenase n=1 Tax=Chitinophaga costaii TaxID=1335309 RepID=A0A1C4EMM5_9BACT|nr:NAD(P)-dependent oxidoreductase [Chitinophaga costaii]PUZ22451.1 NAD(P)-dependent oxidoreductase [Chitinophaga costaii]SCC44848.1 3-hydroxyisobutyrate dehydrogenase [Chitinophaga costaii]
MIAFLGTGLLGANFVKALIKKGEQVQVWNRTTAKAKALEADGAKAFASVADAVKGADVIHLTLKDDATVDEVLATASTGFKPGVLIIDHTTTSAAGAIARTQAWKTKGFTYLHAPVFMGPANALESTGIMLVSGNQEVVKKLEPALSKMTGKVLNFGPEEGKAAGIKLIGNLFLVTFTAGIADTLALAKALHISATDVLSLFDSWNPGALLPARVKRMSTGDYSQPTWELNMARKDTGLFLQAAQAAGVPLAVIPAIAAEMDRYIAQGHGNDDWTVIGKDAVS